MAGIPGIGLEEAEPATEETHSGDVETAVDRLDEKLAWLGSTGGPSGAGGDVEGMTRASFEPLPAPRAGRRRREPG